MTEEDEAFAELEKALGWRKRQLVMKQLDPISNKIRNDALEEVAKEVDNFKAFEKDTMASFAAYVRSMKGAQT
jgi:wobble nucleotide-excising tRNase